MTHMEMIGKKLLVEELLVENLILLHLMLELQKVGVVLIGAQVRMSMDH